MKAEDEKIIVEKARKGDERAFEALVSQYERLVYAVAYKLLGSEQDALDASQETFIKVYLSLGSFRGESKFSVWLYKLANNVCIDMLRKRTVSTVSLSAEAGDGEEIELDLPDERFSPEAELEKKELRCAVNKGLDSLPANYRQVLVLREIGGQSYGEIAEALELDIGTVKSRIFRARKKLCAILTSDGNIFESEPSKKTKGGAQA